MAGSHFALKYLSSLFMAKSVPLDVFEREQVFDESGSAYFSLAWTFDRICHAFLIALEHISLDKIDKVI